MNDLEQLAPQDNKAALEALLLVSSDPVSASSLAQALSLTPGETASLLAELSAEYADANRGFQLREVAGGWRLFTHPAFHDVVESFVLSWDTQKLSQAALETLPERDRALISLRYYAGKTQSQTAAALNMTQVQVSRRENVILQQLRLKLAE